MDVNLYRPRGPATPLHWTGRYGLALLFSAAAVIGSAAFPIITSGPVLFLPFAAVMLSAGYGGLGPSIFSSLACGLITNFYFVAPPRTFGNLGSAKTSELLIFVFTAICVSRVAGKRTRAESALLAEQSYGRYLRSQERQWIADELRENVLPNLASTTRSLHNLAAQSGLDWQTRLEVEQTASELEQSTAKIRAASLVSCPSAEPGSFVPALHARLRSFSERTGLKAELQLQSEVGEVSSQAQCVLLAVVDKALCRMLQDAGISEAVVKVIQNPDLHLEVTGCCSHAEGCRCNTAAQRVGDLDTELLAAAEPVHSIGGSLELSEEPQTRTVRIVLPAETSRLPRPLALHHLF